MTLNQDDRYFESFEDLLKYAYGETPCELNPQLCEPREVKHIIWDADDTIWDVQGGGIASFVKPPLRKVSRESCEGKKRKYQTLKIDGEVLISQETDIAVNLKTGLLETLDELERRGISSSIASSNEPGSVEAILGVLGIRDRFDIIKANWNPKQNSVNEILRRKHLSGEEVIFVDDDLLNVGTITEAFGSLGLVMDADIHTPEEVLKYIK